MDEKGFPLCAELHLPPLEAAGNEMAPFPKRGGAWERAAGFWTIWGRKRKNLMIVRKRETFPGDPEWVRRGAMKRRNVLLREIRRLAECPANDAVRLAFLSSDGLEELEKLDLSAVTEFKRGKDGAVELKFIDRLSALKWLMEQTGEDPRAERLYRALEQTAGEEK